MREELLRQRAVRSRATGACRERQEALDFCRWASGHVRRATPAACLAKQRRLERSLGFSADRRSHV